MRVNHQSKHNVSFSSCYFKLHIILYSVLPVKNLPFSMASCVTTATVWKAVPCFLGPWQKVPLSWIAWYGNWWSHAYYEWLSFHGLPSCMCNTWNEDMQRFPSVSTVQFYSFIWQQFKLENSSKNVNIRVGTSRKWPIRPHNFGTNDRNSKLVLHTRVLELVKVPTFPEWPRRLLDSAIRPVNCHKTLV
jgi:hypothetical protein